MQTAIKGKGAMPPKGGDTSLTDAEVRAPSSIHGELRRGNSRSPPPPAAKKKSK